LRAQRSRFLNQRRIPSKRMAGQYFCLIHSKIERMRRHPRNNPTEEPHWANPDEFWDDLFIEIFYLLDEISDSYHFARLIVSLRVMSPPWFRRLRISSWLRIPVSSCDDFLPRICAWAADYDWREWKRL
jgi:hypothetical protein